ncbi:thiolase-like protein [Camillea tinctor]|nr:thiolase-like protein [Camillea tinctor]
MSEVPTRKLDMPVFSSNAQSSKEYQETNSDPIAVIGMSGINSSSKLWEFLRNGRTGQCYIPPERFKVDAFYHPNGLNRPGSMTIRGGYFLQEDPRSSDPDFFNIIPLEAAHMDPQQRKLLEVVYKAFENYGTTLETVPGIKISITSGELLSGSRPDFGLTFGLSRALMMEQPSTKFYNFDHQLFIPS